MHVSHVVSACLSENRQLQQEASNEKHTPEALKNAGNQGAGRVSRTRQAGFTILELTIVIAVIGLLAYALMPYFKNVMVSVNITPVAKDLNQFAMDTMRSAAQSEDGDPYTNLSQTLLANALERSHLSVRNGTVVRHGLGGGDAGIVTLANSGTQFTITTSKMSPAACPDFITQMQANAVKATVNGTTVKALDDSNNTTTAYSVTKTQAACSKGDTNEAVFTFR